MKNNLPDLISHYGLELHFGKADPNLLVKCLTASGKKAGDHQPWLPLFFLSIAGVDPGFSTSMTPAYNSLATRAVFKDAALEGDTWRLIFSIEDPAVEVQVSLELVPNLPVIRAYTSVTNRGEEEIILTQVSSLIMGGMAGGVDFAGDPGERFNVYHSNRTWEGEGQWEVHHPEELGIFPASCHPDTGVFQLRSVGSFTTNQFSPVILLEDTDEEVTWFAQMESGCSWRLELGHGSDWGGNTGSFFFHGTSASSRDIDWYHPLAPGETFKTLPMAVGCSAGGFEEAAGVMTQYRRSVLTPALDKRPYAPIFFNDYMNCLWGNPTTERLMPLIEKAAGIGAEGFCIDAGWFAGKSDAWGQYFGIYEPSRDRFGDGGVPGILKEISDRGMIPGLWMEMEVCDPACPISEKPDSWFLMRHGKRYLANNRLFYNFANPEVREFYHGIIDRMVSWGCGFIKNDYNECSGPGVDVEGSSPAEGLRQHSEAFQSFIREVRQRHPHLILENCGSGAMRTDYATLSCFDIQSTSDQEDIDRYASIVEGTLALHTPEQSGFWAFPYPHHFLEREDESVFDKPEYKERMADGEQTIYSMINGLMGCPYLSGRIDKADQKNLELIAEGVKLYKEQLRDHYADAVPVWPVGMTRLNQYQGWHSVGLIAPDHKKLILAVWRRDSEEGSIELPLKHFKGQNPSITQIYPSSGYDTDSSFEQSTGVLTVNMKKKQSARMFEIRI